MIDMSFYNKIYQIASFSFNFSVLCIFNITRLYFACSAPLPFLDAFFLATLAPADRICSLGKFFGQNLPPTQFLLFPWLHSFLEWLNISPAAAGAMGLIWVKNSAMVLIYCPIISIWHARCDKNPLATYQSRLGRDSTHLRNGLYWKTAVFQFFAFYDFGHPKWPPNGKKWTWVVIGHMSGYVWRWFRPLRSAA